MNKRPVMLIDDVIKLIDLISLFDDITRLQPVLIEIKENLIEKSKGVNSNV